MKLYSKSSIYEIKKFISQNEQSTVCMAYRKNKHYAIRQKVLLKIFKAQSNIYPLELESLIHVRSNYCVRILHFELIDHKPALILEWIDGINLLQLISSHTLTLSEVSYICYQIQQGLIDLKNHGICHGDLSLSNTLIDTAGRIKLIDFGKGNYTEKEIFSTPYFTAPEILRGEKPHFLSDLFSMGVLEKYLIENSYLKETSINGDPLLDPSPYKRKTKTFHFNSSSQKLLSKKVFFILNKQNLSILKTQPILKNKSKWNFSFLSLIFLGITTSGMQQKEYVGSLNVRSHKWFYIQIGDKTGFTPFSSGPLSTGNYVLHWRNKKDRGSKVITIKEGHHLLLTDKDLRAD